MIRLFPERGGWLEVICGPMFSGKSEELIRRLRRAIIARRRVQVFKSHLDDRYGAVHHLTTHDGITVEAIPVDCAAEIMRRVRSDTEVVAIDEAQFLDEGVVGVAGALADRGLRVILAGTDTDFRGEPFGAMPQLMAVAAGVANAAGLAHKLFGFRLVPLRRSAGKIMGIHEALAGASVLILLVACLNLANLMLEHGEHEIAPYRSIYAQKRD